jgi:HEAT repeat protein
MTTDAGEFVAVVQFLQAALNDRDPSVRAMAAVALLRAAPDSEQAIPVLSALLRTGNAETRFECVVAMAELQEKPRALVPVLADMVGDPAPYVRREVPRLLGAYEEMRNGMRNGAKWRNGNGGEMVTVYGRGNGRVVTVYASFLSS